jgi:cellobiose phosphorylase
MYRVGIEGLLGLSLRAGALHIAPCIPKSWPTFEAVVKTESAEFRITVDNPDRISSGVRSIEVDGTLIHGDVPLAGATGTHVVPCCAWSS